MRFMLLIWLILPALAGAQVIMVEEVLIREVATSAAEGRPDPALAADTIQRAMARGDWVPPVAGVADAEGKTWRPVAADDQGWIQDEALTETYAYAVVEVDADTTLVLEAMGYRGVYLNGVMRVGNIYGYTDEWQSWQPHFDYSLLPVRLQRGKNHLLFFGNRYGVMRARFLAASAPLSFNRRDTTLPDLVAGAMADTWGAIVIMNATGEVVTDARLEVSVAGAPPVLTDLPPLPPFGVRKVGFPIRAGVADEDRSLELHLALSRRGRIMAETVLELAVREAEENRRVTYRSGIDGSVQYYGLLRAGGSGGGDDTAPAALVLSLHGASVAAINQSGSYAPLSWAHIVAPTNRRPFGFNWEDWGRLDALEVLELAGGSLPVDPDRIYLTGHSMGGHGSWHLATLYPDRFAAVGPSAGWISFWSYRPDRLGGATAPLAAMVARASLPSRTLKTAPNLAGLGVYVLHGAEDKSVSATEARTMVAHLEAFHDDLVYHEQAGVGHWWDLSDAPGADCVAWAPMFDFFARHRLPAKDELREISFLTPSPGVSAWNRWIGVLAQQQPFVMSAVDARLDPLIGRVGGTTTNVATLGLDLAHLQLDSLTVAFDGDTLLVAVPADGRVWLTREEADWRALGPPDPGHKGPHRYGGFREAFANRSQLVYATGGTAAENAWALARARYDAEHLWYQGNASLDVIPDTMYADAADPDRNVILYGNADTHARWRELWGDDELTAGRGRVVIGERVLSGEGLGLLAVRPRPGSDRALVGVVAGSGLPGAHLTDRRPYLAPGIAYPDITVLEDMGDGSVVRAAGFLGNDWSLAGGEMVWADAP